MTMPAAESERIRAYLIGQATKLTIPELVEKVRTDLAALKAAGESVPGNQFDARPAEGEWSAAEVWTHVLEMSEHGARSIAWRYVSRFTNACCKRRATSTST